MNSYDGIYKLLSPGPATSIMPIIWHPNGEILLDTGTLIGKNKVLYTSPYKHTTTSQFRRDLSNTELNQWIADTDLSQMLIRYGDLPHARYVHVCRDRWFENYQFIFFDQPSVDALALVSQLQARCRRALEWLRSRRLALAMASHPRLGAASLVRNLDDGVVRLIGSMIDI